MIFFHLFLPAKSPESQTFSVVRPDSEQLAPSSGLQSQSLLFQ